MFKFRLEKLLKIRIKEEENLANLYVLKLKEIEQEKLKLENIISEENRVKEEKLKKNLMATELVQLDNYLYVLKNKKNNQQNKIENLKIEAENIKNQWLEARKKRKILEILKEKQYQKYLNEEKLKEQKLIDEISIIKHLKNK